MPGLGFLVTPGGTTIPSMHCAGLEVWLRGKGWDTVSGTEIDFSRFWPERGTSKPNREKYHLPTQTQPRPPVRRSLPLRSGPDSFLPRVSRGD